MSNRAISKAVKALEDRFGDGIVMKFSDKPKAECISSGREDLNTILGGGYGVGKLIEIYSEEACGKTGLALEAIREVQQAGGNAAIVDCEHALNKNYAEEIGVNIDELYISQPAWGEQAIEVIRYLIESESFDLIIVDSVAAMAPKAEMEGESGEVKMGLHARMMSQAMKLLTAPAATTGTTIIFLNQLRSTIQMYGPSKAPTGGNALKFYASQRLELKKKGLIKEGDNVIGFKQYIKVVKNKIAPPFGDIENDIVYGVGVDHFQGLVEALLFEGIIQKKGAFYKNGETTLAQGIKKLRVVFEDNPDMVEEFEKQLKEARG